jgi:hypothetical protein
MRRTSCLVVLALSTAVVGPAAALFGAGCAVSPPVTVVHVGVGERTEAVRGDAVKTRRGDLEPYGGLRGGFTVVRSAEEWQNAWPASAVPAMPPTFDPARSMLLVAVAEEKETMQLRILKVIETGDRVHVFVRETKVGKNCSAKREQTPLDVVVTERIDKPVKYYVEEERAESCGEAPAVVVNCRVNASPAWAPKVSAMPGDKVDCEMSSETRGKFALVDSSITLGDLPGGSAAKLSYAKGPMRGVFTVDVFGTYGVKAEGKDEAGRATVVTATVEVVPPKTREVLVQLVWTNFDASDDPNTFPRVKLRATEETRDARGKATSNECSIDTQRLELCDTKVHGAYTHMTLRAGDKRVPLEVLYADERAEKGPLVCIQVYFDGARTGETCDRKHRDPDERWSVGTVDTTSGKILDPAPVGVGDAGAPDGGAVDGGGPAKKPAAPKPPAKK